jgi:16S rRNA (guanine527-N7)-methyltransferase
VTGDARLSDLLNGRLEHHALDPPTDQRRQLLAYLKLLARWNRKINLTAFDLGQPTDAAVDRLIIEPVRAAAFIRPTDREAVDIGSGGGSPAIPLAICAPAVRMTMVEVRQRKAAFLREAARTLSLRADVAVQRFEDFGAEPARAGRVDVLSLRAVRTDEAVWAALRSLLAPGAVVLWFGSFGHIPEHGLDTACSALGANQEHFAADLAVLSVRA